MIDNVIIYLLEFSIGSLILYSYYLLVWKNNQAYDTKRALLLAILVLSIIFPLISIESNNLSNISGSFQLDNFQILAAKDVNSHSFLSWSVILLMVYAIGVFLSLLHGFKGLWRILAIRLISNSESKGDHSIVRINGAFPTFSFLNTLYWNEDIEMDKKDQEMIYSHELTHIRQYHSLDLIFISICRIIFWFHPVVHLLYREMALVHECIADREVLKSHSSTNYLSLLANQTLYNMQYQWINQFASVSSLKRMQAIKNARKSPVLFRLALAIPLIAILFTAISCENSVESADENMKPNKSEIVSDAEEMPSFVGGMDAMITYLSESVKYPESARKAGEEGKVFVSFVVEEDGSISNVEVIKGVSSAIDQEAFRVVESMPKWNAGIKDGKKVRTKMTLPIVFTF